MGDSKTPQKTGFLQRSATPVGGTQFDAMKERNHMICGCALFRWLQANSNANICRRRTNGPERREVAPARPTRMVQEPLAGLVK